MIGLERARGYIPQQRRDVNIDLAISDVKLPQPREGDQEYLWQEEYLALAVEEPALELPIQAVVELGRTMRIPPSLASILIIFGAWTCDPEESRRIVPRVFSVKEGDIWPIVKRVYDEDEFGNYGERLGVKMEEIIKKRQRKVSQSENPRHGHTTPRPPEEVREFDAQVLAYRRAGDPCRKIAGILKCGLPAVQEASRRLVKKGLMVSQSPNQPKARY